ncbi:FAD-dependent oxidoreductase [Streptomyces sp. ISL-100]|uniref:FAD-dependent oxidoreductase n=1 Tax=Streptomyces sp. ISL-100 TaxID=2819173 RepID=UPI0027E449C6|nr:FAD-dependent oxidoreductase [Streptomyces sp. ISL-100]
MSYSRLIIATGAEQRVLPETRPLDGVWTLDDSLGLRSALRAAGKVVVVGAGFIASEIASSARSLGTEVTIVEAAAVPLVRAVGEPVGEALAGPHGRNGTRLICGVQVERIVGDERVQAVGLSSGRWWRPTWWSWELAQCRRRTG